MICPDRKRYDIIDDMGHSSRDAGKAFELRIENALTVAMQSRVVSWWAHQQPAYSRFGTPLKPSGADFVFVLRGGVSGCVECKSLKGSRLARSAIAPEQSRHLDAVSKERGLALLAVEFRDEEKGIFSSHLIPWDAVPWKVARSAEAVSMDALQGYKLQPAGSIASMLQVCVACSTYRPLGISVECCRTHGGAF